MKRRHGRRMRFSLKLRRRTPPGAAPGSVLVHPAAARPIVRVISYGPEELVEEEIDDLDRLPGFLARFPVNWIDVEGLGDAEVIGTLGELFGLHPLALEDVVNTHQRAKVEDYGDYLFIVARMLSSDHRLESEQISLFLGKGFVLDFQEGKPGDCLEPVRQRLRTAKGKIRSEGADHLAYALLDAVVDAYFPILENYGDWLEDVDEEVTTRPARETIGRIHDLRGDLLLLRRAIWPLRDALGTLVREPNPLIAGETRVFLRDCYDHTIQIIDLVETSRELCSDLRDHYLSAVGNRMSEVMKVLTIIATLFMPLSFIAGLYGMNFDPSVSPWNMPELRWSFGYPFALGLMAGVAVGMLLFFRRRGWIGW